MDLNQLYFDQQISLIRAQESATPQARREHERQASRIDACIRHLQAGLGAAAACALTARIACQPA